MAYTINKTDGSILTTIADGTVDTTTDISLFGKNYAGYGELLNENQVKILENFAGTTANAPTKPVIGQLFYNTTLKQIQVYDGTVFKATSGSIVSASAPTYGSEGDLWYDSANEQVYVYTGSTWTLVGPAATAGAGTTGSIVTTIVDSTGVSRPVVQLTTGDSIVAMVSATQFTPQTTISGYATIQKGLTLGTQISGNKFQGTATDSDALGGVSSANFLRSNENDTATGTITIQNDSSLVLGQDGDITMTQSSGNFTLRNVTSDGNIIFNVNDGGVNSTVLTLTGADASVTVANNLTISGNLTVSGTTTTVNTTNTTIEDPLIVLNKNADSIGDRDVGLIFDRGVNENAGFFYDESADTFVCVNTGEDGTTAGNVSISSYANLRVGTLTGTATAAQYSDLAERYHADMAVEPGDVVKIGGEKEITKTTQSMDTQVFGVVSTDPAYMMNTGAGEDSTHPFVAMSGRVPCKVKGPVSKGDRLVSSDQPGIAQSAGNDSVNIFAVIGRSLEDNNSDSVKYVEIVVGKN